MKRYLVLLLLTISSAASAQLAESAFHVNWSIMVPTYTEYVGNTSTHGFRVGFTRFMNERFGFGIDGAYNALDDYVSRQTYTYPGGAITTDIFNYMYYYTLTASGKYFFATDGLLAPYAALGAGVSYTEYTQYFNAYSDQETKTAFVARPEAGTYFRFNKYSGFGLKASVAFDYTTNQTDYLELKNFSGLSFQVGIVLFNN